MVNKYLITFFMLISTLGVQAYQDFIITSDEKLTDIKIEDNTILNISPLVTVLNEKNILIVNPLKEGTTKVCVLKNEKDIINFNIKVTENETIIDGTKGFEIFTLDLPEETMVIDEPPVLRETGGQNG